MITNAGKMHIKRYMASYVPSIAQSVAFGIGNSAESASSTKLQFEAGRSDVALTSYDFVNNRLIFKAPVAEEFGGSIYEVAIYSSPSDDVAGEYGSKLLTLFDEATEAWINPSTSADGTFEAGNSRIGDTSLRVAAAAGSNISFTLGEIILDLSGYSGADVFTFAFHVVNSFVSSISFRFMTDASNYYSISLGSQTTGYKIVEAAKSTATATGTPDWSNITEMRVVVNSTAGGSGTVDFDGIRIDDSDTINDDYVMVARKVLSSPFVKQEGKVQELEFSLDISV